MATISTNVAKEYLSMYDGYDSQEVGLGVIHPNAYASSDYQRRKVQNLVLGGLSEIAYSGYEHDPAPLFLSCQYLPQYNVVTGFNLNYCPVRMRSAILKFVLDSNSARIRSNQPLIVDYHLLKRAIPDSQYIYRMFKVVGIRVIDGAVPLTLWPDKIKSPGRWSSHYKILKEGYISK